jgi:hypothetical protein
MFFEGGPALKSKDGGVSCNVCACYMCGCVETCSCSCSSKDDKK